ncbi:MAG: hypothetical protein JRN39_03165 [Nitrososphaerota archaeon]|nr:hypothetical protein [Nitrososphaerota archaeon]MDG6939382.1 hypothetical protein [Nitrososphaerota archaeon]
MVDIFSMEVAQKIKGMKVTTDADLLSEIRKSGELSAEKLNSILLRLEILGVVSVSWMDKDRRRIEYREPRAEQERA